MKKLVLALLGTTLACGLFILASNASATEENAFRSDDFTDPKPITDEMRTEFEQSMSTIHTQFGTFKRADHPLELPPHETAHKMEEITDHTKQIILEHGVFVKE